MGRKIGVHQKSEFGSFPDKDVLNMISDYDLENICYLQLLIMERELIKDG